MSKYAARRLLFLVICLSSFILIFFSYQLYFDFRSARQMIYLPYQNQVQDLIRADIQPRYDQYHHRMYLQISLSSFQNPDLSKVSVPDAVAVEFGDDAIVPTEWTPVVETDTEKKGVLVFDNLPKDLKTFNVVIYLYEDMTFEWTIEQ